MHGAIDQTRQPELRDELQKLQRMLDAVSLEEATDDERVCALGKGDHKLPTAMIYKASVRGEQNLPSFTLQDQPLQKRS